MLRTRTAGSLRASDIGQVVTLTGWVDRRRDHGGVAFIDLRDASGIAQVVIREEIAHDLRAEYVLAVTGEVSARPEGNANPNLPTGEIEVVVSDVEILNASAPLPFQVSDHAEDAGQVGEEARLRYRYLDLRRSAMQHAIRLRAKVSQAARRVLDSHDFVEIETPTLTRSTPEGARDFLVPARLAPGSWYALPQSPQLFKQLLMVAGMERYYQIARCYRDEDFRADRQPEFTQLDVEMSFVEQDDVIAVAEDVLREVWALIDYELPTPIARMTYHDAMERYGSDKPDLRFGCELVDLTDYFKDTTFRVFQNPYVGAVVMPGGASQSRRTFDAWQEWAKQRGAKGLAYVTVAEDGTLGGPVAKNITDAERAGLAQRRNDPAAGGHERRALLAGDSRYLPGHPQAHSGLDDRRSGTGAGDAPAERIDEGVVDGDVGQSAGRRGVHRPLRVSETAKRAGCGEDEEHPRKAGRGCAKVAFGLRESRCVRAEEPQDRLSEDEEDEGQPCADAQGEPHSLDSLPGRLASPARSHELSGGRRRRVREKYAQAHDRRHDRRRKRQPRKRERAEVPDHRGVRGEQQRLGQQSGERRQGVCTNLTVEDPSAVG